MYKYIATSYIYQRNIQKTYIFFTIAHNSDSDLVEGTSISLDLSVSSIKIKLLAVQQNAICL